MVKIKFVSSGPKIITVKYKIQKKINKTIYPDLCEIKKRLFRRKTKEKKLISNITFYKLAVLQII